MRSKDNPKLLHSYIQSKKVGRPTVSLLRLLSCLMLRLDSRFLTDNPGEMAKIFASSFASVYTKSCPNSLTLHELEHELDLGLEYEISLISGFIELLVIMNQINK